MGYHASFGLGGVSGLHINMLIAFRLILDTWGSLTQANVYGIRSNTALMTSSDVSMIYDIALDTMYDIDAMSTNDDDTHRGTSFSNVPVVASVTVIIRLTLNNSIPVLTNMYTGKRRNMKEIKDNKPESEG